MNSEWALLSCLCHITFGVIKWADESRLEQGASPGSNRRHVVMIAGRVVT